jgi:hypothetical protein
MAITCHAFSLLEDSIAPHPPIIFAKCCFPLTGPYSDKTQKTTKEHTQMLSKTDVILSCLLSTTQEYQDLKFNLF